MKQLVTATGKVDFVF